MTIADSGDAVEPRLKAQGPDVSLFRQGVALIVRMLRRAPRQFALAGAGTTLFAVMTVVTSAVMGRVTDAVILPAADRGSVGAAALGGAALAILAVAVLRGIGITARRIGAYSANYHLQSKDRIELTDKYMELPIEWHRSRSAGRLLSNINADAEAAAYVSMPLPMAVGVALMLVITVVVLFVTDPFLALVSLFVAPVLVMANIRYQRKMQGVAAAAQKVRAEVADIAHESFDAALVVKTLGREESEVGRFAEASDVLRDHLVSIGRIRAMFNPAMEALPTLGILVVLAIGAWRVDQGAMTPGTLVTFAYLFRLIALPLGIFGWLLGEVPRATAGADRVAEVMREDGRFVYGSGVLEGSGGAGAGTRDVGYLYPETADLDVTDHVDHSLTDPSLRRGIDDVTLEINPGATVAFVGPTGSGKSTVAQLVVRLFDADRGTVEIDGHRVVEIDRDALAESVALVFQEAFLFNASIHDNITLGADYSAEQVRRAAHIAQADGFVNELADGYETLVGERGASLSGGQRQRIALARALVREPRLLVLDDATSAVDPAVEADILRGLAQLDTSVILVAHRRSSILLADEVLFVEDGTITGRGTHQELYARLAAYRRIVDAYEDAA